MSVNAIEGVVENGRIRLSQDIRLPENAKVYVVIPDPHEMDDLRAATNTARIRTPRLADPRQAKDFQKQIVELPANAKL